MVFTVLRLVPTARSQESSIQIKNIRIIQRLGEKQAYSLVASKYRHGYV